MNTAVTDTMAIIEPAADVNHADVVAEAYRDWQHAVDKTMKRWERYNDAREEAARRRLALGRALLAARGQFPMKGPGSGAWTAWLERLGIAPKNASNWMMLAARVSESDPDDSGTRIPTQREVSAARRREVEPDPPEQDDAEDDSSPAADWAKEIESRKAKTEAPTLDIDAELSRMQSKLYAFAEKVSPKSRRWIAHSLREAAKIIEGMA